MHCLVLRAPAPAPAPAHLVYIKMQTECIQLTAGTHCISSFSLIASGRQSRKRTAARQREPTNQTTNERPMSKRKKEKKLNYVFLMITETDIFEPPAGKISSCKSTAILFMEEQKCARRYSTVSVCCLLSME